MKNVEAKKIENSINDPLVMKRIIDTILDPKNPDSNKINKEIIKNISNCIQKDDAFLTTLKGVVIESAANVTKQIVTKCLDDSKEYLTNALVTTVNLRTEEYFKEKQRIINNILKKCLDDCVQEIIKTTKQSTDKNNKKLSCIKQGITSVNVPDKYKQQVEDYIGFLKSKG